MKSLENVEFAITLGDYRGLISLPKQTTVAALLSIVRGLTTIHEDYGPAHSRFIGLSSVTCNPIIDYWLSQPHLNFSRFDKKLEVRGIYTLEKDKEKISANDFQYLKCLGKGACGEVYLVRNRITAALFAMKRMRKQSIDGYRSLQSLIREKNILISLGRNPHTVTFHASFQSSEHINFLMDYYPGGELFLHLTNQQYPKLTEDQVRTYFCEILLAMEYLHRCKILYRDLKPENILVDILGHLKIADFGLSKSNFAEEDCAVSVCGSPQYMAPEVIDNREYNFSADFYSIGALLFQLLSGYPPYYKQADNDQEEKLQLMWDMSLDFDTVTNDHHLKALLVNLLHADPEKRICNFQQIKNSPWLGKVDWKSIQSKSNTLSFAPDPYGTYVGKEFLELQEEVSEMNAFDQDNFDRELEKLLYFVNPQSRKQLGLESSKDEVFKDGNAKRKTGGFMKEKRPKVKANISIALFEKEESVTTNISTDLRSNRHHLQRQKQNICFKRDASRTKLLSKQASSTNLMKQTNLAPHQTTQVQVQAQVAQVHNQMGRRLQEVKGKAKESAVKQGVRTRMNDDKKGRSKEKSLGRDKSLGKKKKEEKRALLPTCSYKIKLT